MTRKFIIVSQCACLCLCVVVCVCMFLQLLPTECQSAYYTSKVRTCWIVLTHLKNCFNKQFWQGHNKSDHSFVFSSHTCSWCFCGGGETVLRLLDRRECESHMDFLPLSPSVAPQLRRFCTCQTLNRSGLQIPADGFPVFLPVFFL